mmetsp:Transcript_19395/g.31616  ORF Transcript_19395/g.31616 Transcript_19395/m.31616 type:complete len:98 (-) Transcript_19395:546-839(-)
MHKWRINLSVSHGRISIVSSAHHHSTDRTYAFVIVSIAFSAQVSLTRICIAGELRMRECAKSLLCQSPIIIYHQYLVSDCDSSTAGSKLLSSSIIFC